MRVVASRAGFTLLEMILVLSICSLLAAVSLRAYGIYDEQHEQYSAFVHMQSALEEAHQRSRSGSADGAWGVYTVANSIFLFKGDSFATRDTAYDIQYEAPGTISFTPTQEFLFTRPYGLMTPATLTLSQYGVARDTYTVTDRGQLIAQ